MARYVAAIVACGKTKLDHPAPAGELYTGPLVRKAVELAHLQGLPVFILSALHGLVPETLVLEPYDLALHHMPRAQRKAWEVRVHEQLGAIPPGKLLVIAGSNYLAGLRPRLKDVDRPLYGMGIGEQLAELNRLLEIARGGRAVVRK